MLLELQDVSQTIAVDVGSITVNLLLYDSVRVRVPLATAMVEETE